MGQARTLANKQGRKRSAFGYVKAWAGIPRAVRMRGEAPMKSQRIERFATAAIMEAVDA